MGLPSKHFGKKITELFDISQEVSPMCSFSAFLLRDALRFEAHWDHGEQQVEDVARRVNEKKRDRPSQGSRLNKTLNYDLNQALAINISHNAI